MVYSDLENESHCSSGAMLDGTLNVSPIISMGRRMVGEGQLLSIILNVRDLVSSDKFATKEDSPLMKKAKLGHDSLT